MNELFTELYKSFSCCWDLLSISTLKMDQSKDVEKILGFCAKADKILKNLPKKVYLSLIFF